MMQLRMFGMAALVLAGFLAVPRGGFGHGDVTPQPMDTVRNGAVYMPKFEGILTQEGMWAIRSWLDTKFEE